jgi:DNA processing protein
MEADIQLRTTKGLLVLMQVKDVGPQTAIRFADRFVTLSELISSDDLALRSGTASRQIEAIRDRFVLDNAHEQAESIIDKASGEGIKMLSFFDNEYPPLLKQISNPPAVLYLKGSLPEGVRNVACVGTRDITKFGAEVAKRITKMLSEKGYWIISGLALGIDSESHRAAIDSGGRTVAILANGLDSVYPAKNAGLASEIVSSGGGLLSEQPPGVKAFPNNLVARDRLQSGMSLATFVMQTDVIGGTMHTVRYTLEQNRLLFVPQTPKAFEHETQNRGVKALAESTGGELVERLNADKSFRQLLTSKFLNCAPALAIRGQEDYGAVLSRLLQAEALSDRPAVEQSQFF